MALLVILLLTAASARAGEIARWTPRGADGISASYDADHDYYRPAAHVIRFERKVPGPVWLKAGYEDKGYGLLTLTHASAVHQSGVARLNTGKLRHAIFRLEKASFDEPLRLSGAPDLRSLVLLDAEPPAEPVPQVNPALTFRVAGQRVITAGADARTLDGLPEALATMRNLLPLARALGFNGIESYVKWNFVERSPGVFDWSFYDRICDELDKYGLQWFPLLIAGSAYALPEWFYDSPERIGYQCLEHRITIEIPTIFHSAQVKYVRRFLAEFGKHYGSRRTLLGVRLGPSANYGEAQYPATGVWGYKWGPIHTHIGYWAGDPHAQVAFRKWLGERYGAIGNLNPKWGTKYGSFDDIQTFLPETAVTPRMRADFGTWYLWAMSDWCEKWATWARDAMPNTPIYQSSGGWGAMPIGTDYTAQAKSMAKLKGGIRTTNENDSYLNNYCVTRMAASAARFYGAAFGTEPAGFGSARSVAGRIFNIVTNGGDHLFYYHPNLYANDQGIDLWLRHAPLLDRRAKPAAEIAVYYPDTANKLGDETLRYWGRARASVFFNHVVALRAVADFDFASEQMILDGALERYKALVFLWGRVMEKAVLDRIASWVEKGGVVIYPERLQSRDGPLSTIEGDSSVWDRWVRGETGKGRVLRFQGHPDPFLHYVRYVREELANLPQIRSEVRSALRMDKPAEVYWSVLEDGRLVLLNYSDEEAEVKLAGGKTLRVKPYAIEME